MSRASETSLIYERRRCQIDRQFFEPLAPSFMFVGAPGSFTATAVAFNQINLTWQDNSTNETGFEVWRSATGPDGTFAQVAGTGAVLIVNTVLVSPIW